MSEPSQLRAAEIESLLPRLVRILYRSLDDTVITQLPLAQVRIMRLLHAGPRTVTSVGDELGLTVSAVTQMANRLQESGLVERIEDAGDRRVRHLALTEHAQDVMRIRQERRVARMKHVLDHLPEPTQVAVHCALKELVRVASELSQSAPQHDSLSLVAELEQAMPLPPTLRK